MVVRLSGGTTMFSANTYAVARLNIPAVIIALFIFNINNVY